MMVSMRSQRKMPAFSPNFLGGKIFCKLKVSADFQANCPKFHGYCVFYLNDITRRNEGGSLQEKDRMAAHFHISIRYCSIREGILDC